MNLEIQNPRLVKEGYERIKSHIHKTPILFSETLNQMLGNRVLFKIDAMQKTGAFKIRGVMNHLLSLKEQGKMPNKLVAYSTGNHALALGFVAKIFGVEARVYLPRYISPIKKRIAKSYGAEVIEVQTRQEAEECSFLDSKNGYHYIHPSDSDETIAGAGTMAYEAFMQIKEASLSLADLSPDDLPAHGPSSAGLSPPDLSPPNLSFPGLSPHALLSGDLLPGSLALPDYIFASCGGGGLLSGTYLAKELASPDSKLIGCEPKKAADAYQSLQTGSIFRFDKSPDTIADGLRALSISPRTFEYLKRLDDFVLVAESEIFHWTAWLFQLIKVTCEPSSAISMAAAHAFIKKNKLHGKNILILISGGNIDPNFYKDLWKEEYSQHLIK